MRWIAIDGIDGSGKSTIARWMEEHYREQGDRVLVQVHPSERRLGRLARRCLQSDGGLMYHLSSVFFIADVLISLHKMKRWEDEYDDVIFVRYLMATAYLPERLARMGYRTFAKLLPIPSRLLLVDVEPMVALHRIAARQHKEEMFENLTSLTRVRNTVLALSEGWTVLDNGGGEAASRERLEAVLQRWD